VRCPLGKVSVAIACFIIIVVISVPVHAANWLMMQGTEPGAAAGRAKVWGFIQPIAEMTKGTEVKAGGKMGEPAAFNMAGPDLKSRGSFNIRRARIGVRGTGFPLDPKTNYFILAEFGNNGITHYGGKVARVTDASVTLSYVKGARVRIGLFKTPGAEEGLQAIHVFDYINFSNVTNFLLLERFVNADGTGAGPVGAFRDIGVQVFDTFKLTPKGELSYAVMVGNGNGIAGTDNNGAKDLYQYVAYEHVLGGKGARRQGVKGFLWATQGKRTFDNVQYDRDRAGLGVTFRMQQYRAAFEYITADGMIFNGRSGACSTCPLSMLPEDKGSGWYLHLGYQVMPKLELDLRYDTVDRSTDSDLTTAKNSNRSFTTTTLGAQWFFNKKTRATLNYEIRSAEAPDVSAGSPPEKIVDGIDNRISLQLLHIF